MASVTDRQIHSTVKVLQGKLGADIVDVTDIRIRKVLRTRYGANADSDKNVQRVRARIKQIA